MQSRKIRKVQFGQKRSIFKVTDKLIKEINTIKKKPNTLH